MKEKKNVFVLGSCHLFFALTFIFFAPMEVVLLNHTEFHYTIGSFWWFQLILAFLAAGILTLVTMVLPRKARTVIASLSLGAGAAAWAQTIFMNGKMVRLTGAEMNVSKTETIVNLAIWILIVAGIVIAALLLERRGKKAGIWMSIAAGFLTALQLTAFLSLLMTTDFAADSDTHSFTRKGEFELSSGTNVVVFLMDGADGEYVHQMMENYPELNEQLSGWVYYPNMTSKYSRTFPALTYMLSGGQNHLDVPVKEYVDTSFDNSDFLQNIYDAGTNIAIFTMDRSYISTSADGIIANARKGANRISDLNLIGLEKGLARISLFKCLPYACKKLVSYDPAVLNIMAFKDRYYYWYDPYVYNDFAGRDVMKTNGQYQKAFRFYHLWSAHRSATWDDKLMMGKHEQPSYVRLRGSFLLLKTYCDEMKKLGVYDDALIIVIADHGESVGDPENLVQFRAACPLLMVKYPHSEETGQLTVSSAPIGQEDLFATITDALEAKRPNAGSGRAIQEITEGEERERYYYYTAENARGTPKRMLEYVIRGDAENFDNWEETGNIWPALIDW